MASKRPAENNDDSGKERKKEKTETSPPFAETDYLGESSGNSFVQSMHAAAQSGDLERMKLPLDNSSDPNATNENGGESSGNSFVQSMHAAAQSGDLERMKLPLDNGSDPNANNENGGESSGNSFVQSMHAAAQSGDLERMKLLLDSGSDPNATNENGDTPLHICLRKGESTADCVRELVHRGADVSCHNRDNESPIHLALMYKWNISIIQLLILEGYGLDFDRQRVIKVPRNRSPLLGVVAGYQSLSSLLYIQPNEKLAIFFVQMGISQRDLETCLWYELNNGEQESALLQTLMNAFAHLPSLFKLEHFDRSHVVTDNRIGVVNDFDYLTLALVGVEEFDSDSSEDDYLGPDVETWRLIRARRRNMTLYEVPAHTPVAEKKKADYNEKRKRVPSLMHLSRCAVRQIMQANVRKVISMSLPKNIKEYILLGYKMED